MQQLDKAADAFTFVTANLLCSTDGVPSAGLTTCLDASTATRGPR